MVDDKEGNKYDKKKYSKWSGNREKYKTEYTKKKKIEQETRKKKNKQQISI